MNGPQPDYYAILGLTSSATADEIKKQYRELARRYHPDVNSSPDAAQKITGINQAHHVLGDADRRATYDAERLLRRQTQQPHVRHSPQTQRPPERPAPSMDFNGFGRASGDDGHRPPQNENEHRSGSANKSGSFGTAERMVYEAKLAYINHRFKEAERLCQQALLIDPKNADAHEILGDVGRQRGQRNMAIAAYSYAIQFNPRNYSVQAKLDSLLGRSARGQTGPKVTMAREPYVSPISKFVDSPNRENNMATLSVILVLSFIWMLLFFYEHQGIQRSEFLGSIPWISDLSPNLFGALVFEGVIGGILVAFYGGMRPISEELLNQTLTVNKKRSKLSMATVLIFFSLIWFYLSLVVYVILSLGQKRFSTSVLRIYGFVLMLVTLFATIYHPTALNDGPLQCAAFAGNVLFPAMLLGWAIGDAIRLR